MRIGLISIAAIAVAVTIAACGWGTSSFPPLPVDSPSPTAPADPDLTRPEPVTIDIVGTKGDQSFSPSPVAVPVGGLVEWLNRDTVTHHIVFDDGELDSGNIAPGALSTPMPLVAAGRYHCTIHPSMVGAIRAP